VGDRQRLPLPVDAASPPPSCWWCGIAGVATMARVGHVSTRVASYNLSPREVVAWGVDCVSHRYIHKCIHMYMAPHAAWCTEHLCLTCQSSVFANFNALLQVH
jgi:hypothetical protein